MAPFHGAIIPIKLRELNQAQILSCGDFSLIETFEDKIRANTGKPTLKEMIAYADRHHAIAKLSLMCPTYDELLKIFEDDPKIEESRKNLDELKKELFKTPKGPQRSALEEEIDSLKIWIDLILPEDFLSFIVSFALGVDKSDIKKVTKSILLDAAILAHKGSDNPADHVDGLFTPFMRDDINRRAWIIYDDWLREQTASGPKPKKLRMPHGH